MIFLENRTTNFDETWYTFHTQSVDGFEVIWAHITHKQKTQPPKAAKVASIINNELQGPLKAEMEI